MAMIGSQGNLQPPNTNDPEHCFELPVVDKKEVVRGSVQLLNSPQQMLDLSKHISRSVTNMGIDPSNSDRINALMAYVEGSVITTTFYTQLAADTWGRSASNSFSESLDSVHQKYRKIHNFQMKLTGDVDYSYDNRETKSMVRGTAVLYPYLCPYQGDMFIYEASTTKYGLYKITAPPTRLSIESSTCHTIQFSLVTWVDDTLLQKLEACVVDEAYFELTSYLNTKGAFLTADTQKMLADARKAVDTLSNYYMDQYFEKYIYQTFIENACLYDPYIVEFNRRVFDPSSFPMRPRQYVPNPKHWQVCFWNRLLDPDYVPESIMITMALRLHYGVTYRDVDVNPIINSCFIQLQDRDVYKAHKYPPFILPDKLDIEQVTLPMQVRLYLDQRKVFPKALLTLAPEMLTVQRLSGFYYIPILVFLLKKLISALMKGNADIIYQPEEPDNHDNGGCDENCDDCIFGCRPPHLRKITRCPAHSRQGCSLQHDCNTITIPPCGGCTGDNMTYPLMPNRCPPPPRFPDIRRAPEQRHGWTTNAVPPQPPVSTGPAIPIPVGCPPVPPHINPPPPCCPPPPPPPTPYGCRPPEPRTAKIYVINRPTNKTGYLHLQMEMAPDDRFLSPIAIVDTVLNPNAAISDVITSSTVQGFDKHIYTTLDENGVPDTCPMAIVRLEYPVYYMRYRVRYQWVDPDGYELGWIVLR